ncbi:MAG: sulfatase-like hydrolase/transferase, partial [Planctomycetota bacterium]
PDRPITIAKYYAMCEWFDATCGQVIDHLEEKGVRDNTLIVYLTDNGWIQNPEARGYAPRSKQTPFEGGVRTPIMYSWPAALKPADRPELASSIDIYPTILSAAGVEVTSKLPGLDLLPAMRTAKPIERDQIFGEGFAHDVADVDRPEASLLYRWTIRDRWKLILTYDGEINRYKSTHPRDDAGPKLYDLDADPAEQTNLASEHPSVVNELFKSIADWYPLKERVVMQ